MTYMWGIGAAARIGRAGVTWQKGAQLMTSKRGQFLRMADEAADAAEAAVYTRRAEDLFSSASQVVQRRALSAASVDSLRHRVEQSSRFLHPWDWTDGPLVGG